MLLHQCTNGICSDSVASESGSGGSDESGSGGSDESGSGGSSSGDKGSGTSNGGFAPSSSSSTSLSDDGDLVEVSAGSMLSWNTYRVTVSFTVITWTLLVLATKWCN